MEREISEAEARQRLEEAVKKGDLITHFLGDQSRQNSFLRVYRGLHSQLHEGDKLEIEFNLTTFRRHGIEEEPSARFRIVLINQEGKKYFVYSIDRDGSGFGDRPLLYDEKQKTFIIRELNN